MGTVGGVGEHVAARHVYVIGENHGYRVPCNGDRQGLVQRDDVADDRVCGATIAQIVDADGISARGGELRGLRADAATAAGDDHNSQGSTLKAQFAY